MNTQVKSKPENKNSEIAELRDILNNMNQKLDELKQEVKELTEKNQPIIK